MKNTYTYHIRISNAYHIHRILRIIYNEAIMQLGNSDKNISNNIYIYISNDSACSKTMQNQCMELPIRLVNPAMFNKMWVLKMAHVSLMLPCRIHLSILQQRRKFKPLEKESSSNANLVPPTSPTKKGFTVASISYLYIYTYIYIYITIIIIVFLYHNK